MQEETEVVDVTDFEDEVASLRERSTFVLEKVLALPDPPQGSRRQSIKRIDPQIELTEKTDTLKRPSPITKTKKMTTQSMFLEKPEIELPDSRERYETRLMLLNQELQLVRQRNSKLKAKVRDLQSKIGEAKLEEENLREQLNITRQQEMQTLANLIG